MSMSDINQYTPPSSPYEPTSGIRAYRNNALPASAMRSGARNMPKAWQSRGIATGGNRLQFGDEPRSYVEVMLEPVRWCKANTLKGAMLGSIALVMLAVAIF